MSSTQPHLDALREINVALEEARERSVAVGNYATGIAVMVNHYRAACAAVSDAWTKYVGTGEQEGKRCFPA